MAKGAGGGGRGSGRGGGGHGGGGGGTETRPTVSSYGPNIELRDIHDTTIPPGAATTVPTEDLSGRIVVKAVTQGTERQIDYANSLKAKAIETIDRTTYRWAKDPRMNHERLISFRNRLLTAINNDINARSVIDNLKNGEVTDWARRYGITP